MRGRAAELLLTLSLGFAGLADAEPQDMRLMRVFYPPNSLKSFKGQDTVSVTTIVVLAVMIVVMFASSVRGKQWS